VVKPIGMVMGGQCHPEKEAKEKRTKNPKRMIFSNGTKDGKWLGAHHKNYNT
jgi:hypothetical protein